MATFDVRNTEDAVIDTILFADADCQMATRIVRELDNVNIQSDFSDESICVAGRDIPALIKALQKAIELGWDKK